MFSESSQQPITVDQAVEIFEFLCFNDPRRSIWQQQFAELGSY
jgi:hypothetical protein